MISIKNWSEEKYRKVKHVTKVLSVLLCVLLMAWVFPGIFLITHMVEWRYFYGITTIVLSSCFSSAWFILVLVSFDKLRNRPDDLLTSRYNVVFYIILKIILVLLGLGLITGSILLLILR